jgi:hypothetical protein
MRLLIGPALECDKQRATVESHVVIYYHDPELEPADVFFAREALIWGGELGHPDALLPRFIASWRDVPLGAVNRYSIILVLCILLESACSN